MEARQPSIGAFWQTVSAENDKNMKAFAHAFGIAGRTFLA